MRTTHVQAHTRGHTYNDAAERAEAERQRTMWHYKPYYIKIKEWKEADPHITFGLWTTHTRSGTREHAILFLDGVAQGEGDYFWSNRPWQEYTYHDAMEDALRAAGLPPAQHDVAKKFIDKTNTDTGMLKTVAMTAALGDIFGNTQKEKNDWKARMLKAGLADKGLDMPEDWDTLTEDEKERRLNGAIAQLNK